jgi:hypothetical protein
VRELRANGDADAAADLKKLRRPVVPVWALNQVARTGPDAIRDLLDAAAAARRAQTQLLKGGSRDALRETIARQRDAIATVTDAASRVIEQSGRPAGTYSRDIEEALAAIVGSERLAAALKRGELTSLADDGDGGDVLRALADSVGDLPARRHQAAKRPPKRDSKKVTRALGQAESPDR